MQRPAGSRVALPDTLPFVVAWQMQPRLLTEVGASKHDLMASLPKGTGQRPGTGAVPCADVVHVVADHHVAIASQ